MPNSVFLSASPFTVNGTAITIPNTSTFGWADAYFARNAAGVIQALGASGADTAIVTANRLTASADIQATTHLTSGATGYHGWNGLATITVPSAGVFDFENWAESAGVRLSAATDGTAHFLSRAGADTATVRASAYTVGATAGASFSGAVTNLTVVNGIVTAIS